MPGFTIGWEYLTGSCVATDPTNRQKAEWPPHPARVFMALAAAWFETGEDKTEGQALRWLEKLGDPELCLPNYHSAREVTDYYVPVNDVAGPSKAILQSAPGFTRDRKERSFPSVWVGEANCFLHWPFADSGDVERYQSALDQLCRKVTRIGHSSSLVRMFVASETSVPSFTNSWVPDLYQSDFQIRCFTEGTLDQLDFLFNRRGRDEYQNLSEQIVSLENEKPKGKGAKQQREDLKDKIAKLKKRLESVDNRDAIRPKHGFWTGYRRKESQLSSTGNHTDFDSDLLILTQTDGPRLPLSSTLAVTQALRGALLKHIGSSIPDWVSGHKPNGEPLRDGNRQLGFIPLADVGYQFSDGHLLGTAIVFPRSVSRPERGKMLGRFILGPQGQTQNITLTLGALGVWTLVKRDWGETRKALTPETWTAHPNGSKTWASVTPMVLDRFPKCDPFKERHAWEEEIAGIVVTACERQGLPAPIDVAVGTTSWHSGSPRSKTKHRPLRGHSELAASTAALGDGFPIYPNKGGNGARPQFHIRVQFLERVIGPILLGAGRFLGYGLCKPLWGGTI